MFDKLKGNASPANNAPKETPQPPARNFADVSKPDSPPPVPTPQPSVTKSGGNILSKDVSVTGKITLTGDIAIDGKVEGEITTQGTITINQNAIINAKIKAGNIIVHGTIEGNLDAKERIELHHTAKIIGDLRGATLKVDSGAVFVGNSAIGASVDRSAKPKATAPPANRQEAVASAEN